MRRKTLSANKSLDYCGTIRGGSFISFLAFNDFILECINNEWRIPQNS